VGLPVGTNGTVGARPGGPVARWPYAGARGGTGARSSRVPRAPDGPTDAAPIVGGSWAAPGMAGAALTQAGQNRAVAVTVAWTAGMDARQPSQRSPRLVRIRRSLSSSPHGAVGCRPVRGARGLALYMCAAGAWIRRGVGTRRVPGGYRWAPMSLGPGGAADGAGRVGAGAGARGGCRWVVLRSKLKGRFENATIGG